MKRKIIEKFIMVDIETLSTNVYRPCVTQIGLCYAVKQSSRGWKYFSAGGSCAIPDMYRVEQKTLEWWTDQGGFVDMLKASLQSEFTPAHLFLDCLEDISLRADVPTSILEDTPLVANPPSFDIAILRTCFQEEKITFPFHWSKELDYRTLKNVHFDARKEAEEQMANLGEGGVRHDAIYDATLQARAMTDILNSISA